MDSQSTLLVVKNLSISKDFYAKILDLNILEEYEDSLKFQIGSHNIFMFQGAIAAIDYEHGTNANSTLVITVSDLDEKIKELTAKGVIFIWGFMN